MNGDKAEYSNLKENQLALSYKGWRWCGCSCSKYSNTIFPGELQTSVSSPDELRGGLSLNVSLLILWLFKLMRSCWPCSPSTMLLARLSASQSLLPALLVSLEDSASLSSPGLLVKHQSKIYKIWGPPILQILFTTPPPLSLSPKKWGQLWILNKLIRVAKCFRGSPYLPTMSGFIHVKMTKFYVGCQPTIILLLFPDLGPAVNKIYDTKSKHRHKWSNLTILPTLILLNSTHSAVIGSSWIGHKIWSSNFLTQQREEINHSGPTKLSTQNKVICIQHVCTRHSWKGLW